VNEREDLRTEEVQVSRKKEINCTDLRVFVMTEAIKRRKEKTGAKTIESFARNAANIRKGNYEDQYAIVKTRNKDPKQKRPIDQIRSVKCRRRGTINDLWSRSNQDPRHNLCSNQNSTQKINTIIAISDIIVYTA
jgi:hypothetical protein